ncbi:serine/threonine-protein kinase [Sphaerisporangium perillae]|uniref:serine/threonine-protein kinase n=1 Tax=Sphaerisporangium perillae TaxID=2935860 RepID=UPI00200EAEE3|nr:serine/threonine-protein kinase [Sphaerisporangium perillae]
MSTPVPLRAEDPRQLGGYRLVGRLGRGGQGIVYLGESPGGARVAVKLMHSRLDEEKARRRFTDEVEAVRRVAPFCTVQVLDADLDGDRPYIVSEYVDGVSLQEHVTTQGPRTGGSLDRIAVGTATALAAIHEAGVVHRDFKPGNVLLGLDGPRVIDFGISRLMDTATTTGRVPVGTPAYISPEQLKGERAGPSADMFGWGLTVAFTASGRHAYAADSFEAILGRILFGQADLDPLTGPLREIVVACLDPDPAGRPSAEEALRHLIGRGPAAVPASGAVLETGAILAARPLTREPEAPATLPFDRYPGHDDAPATLTFAPVTDGAPAGGGVPVTVASGRDEDAGDEMADPSHRPARRRRARMAGLAGLALLVAGAVTAAAWWWPGSGAGEPATPFSYAGRWTGSAEHPTAGRVFPVEIRFAETTTAGTMKWGADLHCTGRLTLFAPKGAATAYRLDQVRGDQCHPGTVLLSPQGTDRLAFRVTGTGDAAPRYAGTAARIT